MGSISVAVRGKRRNALKFPIDAVTGHAAKVKAEISGAKESLMNVRQIVMVALQVQAARGIEDLQKDVERIRLGEHDAAAGPIVGQPPAWELPLSALKYTTTRWVGLRMTSSWAVGALARCFAPPLTEENCTEIEVAVKEPHDVEKVLNRVKLLPKMDTKLDAITGIANEIKQEVQEIKRLHKLMMSEMSDKRRALSARSLRWLPVKSRKTKYSRETSSRRVGRVMFTRPRMMDNQLRSKW